MTEHSEDEIVHARRCDTERPGCLRHRDDRIVGLQTGHQMSDDPATSIMMPPSAQVANYSTEARLHTAR